MRLITLASHMHAIRPRTDHQLHAWIRAVLGFDIPRRARIEGHAAPFEYVRHAFFETGDLRDCIVWANRGGGKTQLGAIVTLLDLVFKPGIQVRILGGSFDQSSRMYRFLREMLDAPGFASLVDGGVTGRAVDLVNGSRVEVLSQSERAVRGQRVHKLRCDEVDLFEPDVWAAAQLVTRSGRCGDTFVSGAIEAISTMHRPHGLMQRLVSGARDAGRRVFRWSVLDTLERCPPSRPCAACPLAGDCDGRAKRGGGFLTVDDAVRLRARVDAETWETEMLCARPSRSDTVYPSFRRATHVRAFDVASIAARPDAQWVGGIDFGFRAPTVLLLALAEPGADGMVWIVDEHVAAGWTTAQHVAHVHAWRWPRPVWLGADPAGHQRSEQTGVSTIAVWRRSGIGMRTHATTIESGLRAVHRRLRTADGASRLVVHSRCARLIESLETYHYPANRPSATEPVKDGADHAADALRYLVVNLDGPGRLAHQRPY